MTQAAMSSISNSNRSLPIDAILPQLLQEIGSHQQFILKAEPGAGKSTQLPLQLLKQKVVKGKIIMLEPRRLAAKNIARFIANRLDEQVGRSVGYRIKGESKVSQSTKLEIVTEGILTQMIQSDPELAGVDLIIFDEFHERSINSDTALAFALEIQEVFREDLKLLVMSATLDKAQLLTIMPDAKSFESEGRSFPVNIEYQPLANNEYLDQKVIKQICSEINRSEQSILVFLPGTGLILRVAEQLRDMRKNGLVPSHVEIAPLYGQLDYATQQKAIQSPDAGKIKVVLSTNIAETSLTIESISTVIDSGLERVADFDLNSGVTRLKQVSIAQSSAIQRTGRAGRVMAGRCVRLYSETHFSQQQKVPKAEILKSDLSSLILELAFWGATQAYDMQWIDLPPKSAIDQAKILLCKLKLLDETGNLTSQGEQARTISSDPRVSAMLISVKQNQNVLLDSAILLAAIIEEYQRSSTNLADSVYEWKNGRLKNAKQITQRAHVLSQRLKHSFNSAAVDLSSLGLILSYGFPDRVAQKRANSENRYLMANGHGIELKQDDPLTDSDYLVAVDLMRSHSSSSQLYSGADVLLSELTEHRGSHLSNIDFADWDEQKGNFIAEKQTRWGELIVERKPHSNIPPQLKTNALLHYVQKQGLECLSWSKECHQLQQRVICADQWCDEHSWPDFSTAALLTSVNVWLEPYLSGISSAKALKKVNIEQALMAYLAWPLNQEIDKLLPTHWIVPTGSKKTIVYDADKPPMLSVRMQEMYGEKVSPTVAQGKVAVTVELLSPAQRPLQVTQDLASFWSGSYSEVKKEMKGRYPKHIWPDDPANHVATKKTKRHFNS